MIFEYAGPGALAVTGRITGTRYTFPRPGARAAVQAADAAALIGIRGMRPVR